MGGGLWGRWWSIKAGHTPQGGGGGGGDGELEGAWLKDSSPASRLVPAKQSHQRAQPGPVPSLVIRLDLDHSLKGTAFRLRLDFLFQEFENTWFAVYELAGAEEKVKKAGPGGGSAWPPWSGLAGSGQARLRERADRSTS